jgi:3-hydroxyisobutyrate dehydrogenase-like beta-hydroxyacid dehydrogenase
MASLGFVGLGNMGGRIARRLLDAGHAVVGYNRTREKCAPLVRAGLTLAATPREVAAVTEVVFTMVSDPRALDAVTHGPDGILAGLRPGGVYVDMSTVGPVPIRALGAEVAARGASMLDAPVSGSPITLDQGQLSIMVGGDAAVLERVRPYLSAIGPTITHVGELGLAATMKIAANLGLAVQMLAFSEAVLLAEKAGVARERAVEALLQSVIASPMLKYRGPFVLEMPEQGLFNVPMMQKDLRLALDLGRSLGVVLPATTLSQEMLTAAGGLGLGHYDFAIVFDVIASLSALDPSAKQPESA